jgi:hypothetical protein
MGGTALAWLVQGPEFKPQYHKKKKKKRQKTPAVLKTTKVNYCKHHSSETLKNITASL